MKKQLLIGIAVGALLLMVILTIAPVIDSRSMNPNQFSVAGNYLTVLDGVRLTNQQTAIIKDDAGVTRIIQVAGGSSGFNDGFGVNRVQIDAGGVIKLKATNAAQLFQLTGDGYGEASFPWTFDNGILVGGSTNSAVWLWNGNSAHYYQALFTDGSGNTVIEPDNNLQILHADVTIDKSVAAERAFFTNGVQIYAVGLTVSGSGGSLISQTASNGLGIVNIRPDFTMANTQTVVWPTNLPAVGQHLGVKATNWYGTTNLEIQTDWETASGSQTPWSSDINGNGFLLTNVFKLALGTTVPAAGTQNPSIWLSGTNSAGTSVFIRERLTNSLWTIDPGTNSTIGATPIMTLSLVNGNMVIPGTMNPAIVQANSHIDAGSSSYFTWGANSKMGSPVDSIIKLWNSAQTDFRSLLFGGVLSTNGQIRFLSSTTLNPQFEFRDGTTNNDSAGWANISSGSHFLSGTNVIGAPGMQGPLMGCQLFSDGTNLVGVFQNAAGTRTTNKFTMSAWP